MLVRPFLDPAGSRFEVDEVFPPEVVDDIERDHSLSSKLTIQPGFHVVPELSAPPSIHQRRMIRRRRETIEREMVEVEPFLREVCCLTPLQKNILLQVHRNGGKLDEVQIESIEMFSPGDIQLAVVCAKDALASCSCQEEEVN